MYITRKQMRDSFAAWTQAAWVRNCLKPPKTTLQQEPLLTEYLKCERTISAFMPVYKISEKILIKERKKLL